MESLVDFAGIRTKWIVDRCNGQVCIRLNVLGYKIPVIHLINVISGENENKVGIRVHPIDVLKDCICRTAVSLPA